MGRRQREVENPVSSGLLAFGDSHDRQAPDAIGTFAAPRPGVAAMLNLSESAQLTLHWNVTRFSWPELNGT